MATRGSFPSSARMLAVAFVSPMEQLPHASLLLPQNQQSLPHCPLCPSTIGIVIFHLPPAATSPVCCPALLFKIGVMLPFDAGMRAFFCREVNRLKRATFWFCAIAR